jgi:hypothetical protein
VFWVVATMVAILVVAFFVIARSSEAEDDWSTHRPGRSDPDEGHLEDLLGP